MSVFGGEEEGGGVRCGPGETRTILILHIISVRPSKQPLMVRTFLKVYMELGSCFLFLQEHIQDIIIITTSSRTTTRAATELSPPKSAYAGDAVLRTSTRGTVPMGSALGAIKDNISRCPFLQVTFTAEIQHITNRY